MRRRGTHAEVRVWDLLRDGRLGGLKFRRQVPLEGFILDFVCFDARLIVEVDGSQHLESVSDLRRDAHFANQGFETLRIWNVDVLTNLDGVALEILRVAQERMG